MYINKENLIKVLGVTCAFHRATQILMINELKETLDLLIDNEKEKGKAKKAIEECNDTYNIVFNSMSQICKIMNIISEVDNVQLSIIPDKEKLSMYDVNEVMSVYISTKKFLKQCEESQEIKNYDSIYIYDSETNLGGLD